MISFQPTEDEITLVDTVRRFAQSRVRPAAASCEQEGRLPPLLVSSFWDLGLSLMNYSPEIGGSGLGQRATVLAEEELAWGDPTIAVALPRPGLAGDVISGLGMEVQSRWLAPFASAEPHYLSAALSERSPGEVTASKAGTGREDHGFLLNGQAYALSAARAADWILVVSLLDSELALFAVSPASDGFSVASDDMPLGLRGSGFGGVVLDHCALEAANLLVAGALAVARAVVVRALGVARAGYDYLYDPFVCTMGYIRDFKAGKELPMATGLHVPEEGIVMTDLMTPPTMYAGSLAIAGQKGIMSLPKVLRYKNTLSIMIKVRDGLDGRINLDESFSKPIDYDTWWKLNKGAVLAEEILMKAGVRRDDLVQTGVIAAHPGGTVRIGELLDKDCQTPIQNCYCMDTTIIPEPWGLPPTVTVVAMAKRLANHLTVGAEARVAVQEPV